MSGQRLSVKYMSGRSSRGRNVFWQQLLAGLLVSRAKIGVLLVAILVVAGLAVWWWPRHEVSVVASEPVFSPIKVEQQWRQVMIAYDRMTVGVELWDVQSGMRASVNGLRPFQAASVSKLVTASYLLHQVEVGRWSLDRRLADGVTTEWHLEQMVRNSNNDSWKKIRDAIGRKGEAAYAKSLGLSSYDLADNTVSANDMSRLLVKLAKGDLLEARQTKLLLSMMVDTYEERFMPQFSPAGSTVYHKTGTLQDDIHDVGIVEYQGRRYVLTILTNGNGSVNYDIRMNLYKELEGVVFEAIGKQ